MLSAGLIFDDSPHYLDHLAPFCALRGWPLIVCEGALADLARHYYPDLAVIETNLWNLALPDTLVCCSPRRLFETSVQAKPPARFFWLPHGNSDKGWTRPSFEALGEETALLVYGQKMIDFLNRKGVSIPVIQIGNFRLEYWKRNRPFYDTLMAEELRGLSKEKSLFLYAPTWNDAEGNGSFWEMFPLLARHLPDNCNLAVKLHPNTYNRHPAETERWIGMYASRKNILFLTEFPPIYPLLNLSNAYIGDMSSIGYDFLHWNRPMFFLNGKKCDSNNDPSLFLHRCGEKIIPAEIASVFADRAEPAYFSELRTQIYAYTFDCSHQHRP